MARRNLNLDNACRYLSSLRVTQLDGICVAIKAKMEELGVKAKQNAARAYEFDGEITGSLKGIQDYVASLTAENVTKGDKKSLQILDDIIGNRITSAGYTVKEESALT